MSALDVAWGESAVTENVRQAVATLGNLVVSHEHLIHVALRSDHEASGANGAARFLRNFFLKATSALGLVREHFDQMRSWKQISPFHLEAIRTCLELAPICFLPDVHAFVPPVIVSDLLSQLEAFLAAEIDGVACACNGRAVGFLSATAAAGGRASRAATSHDTATQLRECLSATERTRRASADFLKSCVTTLNPVGMLLWTPAVLLCGLGINLGAILLSMVCANSGDEMHAVLQAAASSLAPQLRADFDRSKSDMLHWLDVFIDSRSRAASALQEHAVAAGFNDVCLEDHHAKAELLVSRRLIERAASLVGLATAAANGKFSEDHGIIVQRELLEQIAEQLVHRIPQVLLLRRGRAAAAGCRSRRSSGSIDAAEAAGSLLERSECAIAFSSVRVTESWVADELQNPASMLPESNGSEIDAVQDWATSFRRSERANRTLQLPKVIGWLVGSFSRLFDHRSGTDSEEAVVAALALVGIARALSSNEAVDKSGGWQWTSSIPPMWLENIRSCQARLCSSILHTSSASAMPCFDATLPDPTAGFGQRRPWRLAVVAALVADDLGVGYNPISRNQQSGETTNSESDQLFALPGRSWTPTFEFVMLALACLRDELCSLSAASEQCAVASGQLQLNWYFHSRVPPTMAGANAFNNEKVNSVCIAQAVAAAVTQGEASFVKSVRSHALQFLCSAAELQFSRAEVWTRASASSAAAGDAGSRHRRASLQLFFRAALSHFLVIADAALGFARANPMDPQPARPPPPPPEPITPSQSAAVLQALARLDIGFDRADSVPWRRLTIGCMTAGGPQAMAATLRQSMQESCRLEADVQRQPQTLHGGAATATFLREQWTQATLAQVDHFLRSYFPRLGGQHADAWGGLTRELAQFLAQTVVAQTTVSDRLRETGHRLCHFVAFELGDDGGMHDLAALASEAPAESLPHSHEFSWHKKSIQDFRETYVHTCVTNFPQCGLRKWLPALLGRVCRATTAPLPTVLRLQLPHPAAVAAAARRSREASSTALLAVERVCCGVVDAFISPVSRSSAIEALARLHKVEVESRHTRNTLLLRPGSGDAGSVKQRQAAAVKSLGPTPPAALALLLLLCECFKLVHPAVLPLCFDLLAAKLFRLTRAVRIPISAAANALPLSAVEVEWGHPWFRLTGKDKAMILAIDHSAHEEHVRNGAHWKAADAHPPNGPSNESAGGSGLRSVAGPWTWTRSAVVAFRRFVGWGPTPVSSETNDEWTGAVAETRHVEQHNHNLPMPSPTSTGTVPACLEDTRVAVLNFVFDNLAAGNGQSMAVESRHFIFDCYVCFLVANGARLLCVQAENFR